MSKAACRRMPVVARLCSLWMVCCLMLWNPLNAGAVPDGEEGGGDAVPGLVVVQFRPGVALPDGAAKTGLASFDDAALPFGVYQVDRAYPFLDQVAAKRAEMPESVRKLQRVYYVRYGGPDRPRHVADVLARDPNVAWAEPEYVYRLFERFTPADVEAARQAVTATPNDPRFSAMVHLPHLNLPEAWDVVKGEQGDVVIAIVDGGTDWRHPDLQANVWANPGEIPENGVDDDENGFVDDVQGWNFGNNSPDPTGLFRTPGNARHGTTVAGTAAAVTDNGEGIAGASWNAVYMPVGAGCETVDDSICFAYPGVVYAAANGADVINASWGGPVRSEQGELAVEGAFDLGALVVAAAGNEGVDNDRIPTYPASFPRVLSVGATFKSGDAKVSFSNYGRSVDVFAPGLDIDVTFPNEQIGTISGTSFSAPLVSAIAALAKTRFPALSGDQLREQIRTTAENIDAFNPTLQGRLGRGRAHALRAVTETGNPAIRLTGYTVAATGGERPDIIEPGETVTVTASFINYLADASDVVVELALDDPFITITGGTANVGALASDATTTATFTFETAPDIPKGHLLVFSAEVTAGAYTDADLIRVVGNETSFATHSSGRLDVSITDEGNIGWLEFAEESLGQGFVFAGRNALFEGGLMVATGPNAVMDCVRGLDIEAANQHMDFVLQDGTALEIFSPGEFTAEQGQVTITDAAAANPLGLLILQDSFVDTAEENQDFVIFRYTLTNTGNGTLNDLHLGLFFDWDVNRVDPAQDVAGFDEQRQFGYIQESQGSPRFFVGPQLLTSDAPLSYHAVDNPTELFDGGFTEQEKWDFLSGGVQTKTRGPSDVSQVIGTGPFLVEPGASIEVAFALVAGRTVDNLLASVDAAQALWDRATPVEEPLPAPAAFAFDPVYPNPTAAQAALSFRLPEPSRVTLTVYDVLGRAVHALLAEHRGSGPHTVTWDGRDRSGRPVAGGLYLARLTAEGSTTTFSKTQRVVVVR